MEFLQSLEWAAILKIIGIDIMLGVDNAIVIALACAALPVHLRRKAIIWGTAGAIGLRAILLVFAGFLMGVPYIKAVAGAYLLYIGYKLLVENGDESHDIAPADRVWTAVKTILIADFMMSLDNVLAVAGAAESAGAHSTLYAIAGIVLSIPVIIFGATGLVGIMKRFPVIVWIGGGLLGWVGVEMVITDPVLTNIMVSVDAAVGPYSHAIFKALGFAVVVGFAYLMQKRSAAADANA